MDDEYLPLSMLNALAYCPRRYYYEHVLGEMLVNEHVLEGRQRHERVDAGRAERIDGDMVLRSAWVYSDRLRLVGVVDVVEEGSGGLVPVEYKKGRGGEWVNDQVQLGAAMLCLEEQLRRRLTHGYLFYFGPQRRVRADLTSDLRRMTEEMVEEARAVARAGQIPPPLVDDRRCRECSLEPLCLPREVRLLAGL